MSFYPEDFDQDTHSLLRSDGGGEFRLDFRYIPMGEEVTITGFTSPDPIDTIVLSDSLGLLLMKEPLIWKFRVDTTTTLEHAFELLADRVSIRRSRRRLC